MQPTGQPHFLDGNPRILAGRTHRNVWLSLLNERFFINSHPVMSRRLLREKNDYSWSRSKKRSILYQEKGRIASLCFVMTCCVNFVPAAIGEMSLLPKKITPPSIDLFISDCVPQESTFCNEMPRHIIPNNPFN